MPTSGKTKKQSLREIYNDLYYYFGLRSRDSYLNAVEPTAGKASPTQSAATSFGDVFYKLFADDVVNADITEICKDVQSMGIADSREVICITPYLKAGAGLGGINVKELPMNGTPATGDYKEQGHIHLVDSKELKKELSKNAKSPNEFTVAGMSRLFDDSHPNRIDVIQVFPSHASPELADTDVLTLYLSTITSANMSLAIPYVNVLVSTSGKKGFDIFEAPFSFGGFLTGETQKSSGGKVDYDSIGEFVDQSVAGGSPSSATNETQIKTVASMEIFTSPQTLVNATPENVRYDENSQAGRHIDIFRPFLSIESLNLSVVSSGNGLIAFKTGTMKLKLFDRGRLQQIAPLVAPSRFNVVKFDIEYGWSHPGGGEILGRSSDANADRIGQLIDSMRVLESYQVVNSNFTFEPDGSVSIDLKLSMLGKQSLSEKGVKFSASDADSVEIEHALESVRRLLQFVPKEINVPAVLSGGADSFINMSEEDFKELRKFVDAMHSAKNIASANDAAVAIASLIGPGKGDKPTPTSILGRRQATKEEQAQKFINRLQVNDDPFIRYDGLANNGQGVSFEELSGKNNYKYSSLGSIIVNALGPSLQGIGDVIFIFGCFNKNAGAMYDHNISQFPIKTEGQHPNEVSLQSVLKKELKRHNRITPEDFMQMINQYFASRESTEAYGLSRIYRDYQVFEKEDQISEVLVGNLKKENDKVDTQINFENVKIGNLQTIYGPNRLHPTFTQPRLAMKIDVKPNKAGTKNIARITIFDQAASNVGDAQEMFNEITANGFFEKDYYGPNYGIMSKARSANHGQIANLVFNDLTSSSVSMLEKFAPTKETTDQSGKKIPGAANLLEKLEQTASQDPNSPIKFETNADERQKLIEKLDRIYFLKELKTSDLKLRDIFYRYFPTLIYGSMGSGIISAQLASNQNPALTTIALQRQEGDPPLPVGLPMLIHPTQLSMDVFGSPLFKYSQKFFIDFGTGTSADNFYVVTGVDMSFGPGEFKCSLKMTQLDAFGRFMKTRDSIFKALIAKYKKQENDKAKK